MIQFDGNGRAIWPFPSINGQRTVESQSLIDKAAEPKKSVYDICLESFNNEPIEDAAL